MAYTIKINDESKLICELPDSIWANTGEIVASDTAPTAIGSDLIFSFPAVVTENLKIVEYELENVAYLQINSANVGVQSFPLLDVRALDSVYLAVKIEDNAVTALRFVYTSLNNEKWYYTETLRSTAFTELKKYIIIYTKTGFGVDTQDGVYKFTNNQYRDLSWTTPFPFDGGSGLYYPWTEMREAAERNLIVYGDDFYHNSIPVGGSKSLDLPGGGRIELSCPSYESHMYVNLYDTEGNVVESFNLSSWKPSSSGGVGRFGCWFAINPYSTSNTYTLQIVGIRTDIDPNGRVGFYNLHTFSEVASSKVFEGSKVYPIDQTMDDDTSSTDPGDGVGGTDGRDFKDTSDPIDFGTVPAFSVLDSGFVTLYNPTEAQIQTIAGIATGDASFVTDMLARATGLVDSIISIHTVPVPVETENTAVTVKMFGLPLVSIGGTNGVAKKVTSQYVELDCGTIDVEEWFGSVLDYAPNTKLQIYLPFCGTHQLDVNDFMSKRIWVVYKVDVLTGLCVAMVSDETSVKYTFQGNCAMTFPITSRNWVDAVTGAATGVLSATANAMSGNMVSAVSGAMSTVSNFAPTISHGGGTSMSGGYLMNRYPYLILERPNRCLPVDYSQYSGRPAFVTKKVSECSGYVEFEQIHCDGITATSEEMQKIESLMKGGVLV